MEERRVVERGQGVISSSPQSAAKVVNILVNCKQWPKNMCRIKKNYVNCTTYQHEFKTLKNKSLALRNAIIPKFRLFLLKINRRWWYTLRTNSEQIYAYSLVLNTYSLECMDFDVKFTNFIYLTRIIFGKFQITLMHMYNVIRSLT